MLCGVVLWLYKHLGISQFKVSRFCLLRMSTTQRRSESQESDEESVQFECRNYTDLDENYSWYLVYEFLRKRAGYSKEGFRSRRFVLGHIHHKTRLQAFRTHVGKNDEIGAFVKLTNSYSLIGGDEESENFCRMVSGDLPEIPVISTSLSGCRVIGCMCVGNKHGLIVPETIYDTELLQIKEKLPDSVEIKKAEERLSALGNVVVCNDHVALVHPELDKETEEVIADTLQVEVFRHLIANNPLVGSYCVLNNTGGLVCPDMSKTELENLSSLLDIPLITGTVNRGNKAVASSCAANDRIAYVGMKTTAKEFSHIDKAFGFPKHVKRK